MTEALTIVGLGGSMAKVSRSRVAYYESRASSQALDPARERFAAVVRSPSRRVWLVIRNSDVAARCRAALERTIAQRYLPGKPQTRFRNLTVILYTPSGTVILYTPSGSHGA